MEDEKKKKLWKIGGKWYDLSEFREKHPGGRLALDLFQGSDATHAFEQYHLLNDRHYKILEKMSPKYVDSSYTQKKSEFHQDIKRMLREYFQDKSHKMPLSHFGILIVLMTIYLWSIIGWYNYEILRGLVLFPFLGWLIMANYAHDGSHFAVSRKYPKLNEFCTLLASPLYYSYGSWYMQHCVSHHYHTNDPQHDIDLQHHPFCVWHADSVILKEKESQKHYSAQILIAKQFFWHFTAFLLSTFNMAIVHPIKFIFYPMFHLHVYPKKNPFTPSNLQDCHEISFYEISKRFILDLNFFKPTSSKFLFAFSAWLVSLSFLLLPFFRAPSLAHSIVFAFFPFFLSSFFFMIVTQISHVQPACQENQQEFSDDFFKQQAATSFDYATSSYFWYFCTGGLNLQSIHHVLPSISSAHYVSLYPKFASICQKHLGSAPSHSASLLSAFCSHLAFVAQLALLDGDAAGDDINSASVIPKPEEAPFQQKVN